MGWSPKQAADALLSLRWDWSNWEYKQRREALLQTTGQQIEAMAELLR